MEIAILRHGMPESIPENFITASEFSNWIKRYNASGLADRSVPPECVVIYSNGCSAIISSSLQRSIDSANILDTEKLLLSDSLFIEAGLPSANWGFLKMPPKVWALFFRVLWFFGYSNNSESIKEATKRAALATDRLIQLAVKHHEVLFVGHGIFNRLLVKELKKRGWSGPGNPKSKHWGLDLYVQ